MSQPPEVSSSPPGAIRAALDTATHAALSHFSESTQAWFTQAFQAPTSAQAGAWEAIAGGDHALVVAPTGSGKTLAAFLWGLDSLMSAPPVDPAQRCRILYVSPLKALAADVERNLRSPLVGISRTAQQLGLTPPDVRVGIRTGDTPANERRTLATRPPDILITTPESLFLVLTSAAREGLRGVTTVILDEVHVMAGSKRGAHLAVSLERLDEMLERPAQRIGLSATVRPVEVVQRFLSGNRSLADGGRPTRLVVPKGTKQLRIDVAAPVPDLTDLDDPLDESAAHTPVGQPNLAGEASGDLPGTYHRTGSIWPHITRHLVDVISEHTTTLVFTNSRRSAERLTARLNEEWALRHPAPADASEADGDGELTSHRYPADMAGQSGIALDVPIQIARAHHGSMSREARTVIEDDLKSGRLPAVVATSSLELGIDMGSIDIVVQIGAPPSVASALQRIGRAGHQVGALSHGEVIPTHRGDLMPAVAATRMARAGLIEEVKPPLNPLDVLAQQIVAMLAVEDLTLADLTALLRRSAPFHALGEASLHAVLDMLAGRYPSEDFASLRPRIVWDRTSDLLSARPGALRLAVTSGGTIPDRGLFGVYLAGSADSAAARGGRRVGELDEEMVFESRVGDTFTLGSSTWRIEEITPDRVLVTPAPGVPGRLPFWKGDQPGRPEELGRALGAMVGEVATSKDRAAVLAGWDLTPWTQENLLAYFEGQLEAVGHLATDTTLVIERFRDDLGDWRVVIHSPFGAKVHAPWALALVAKLRDRLGMDVAAMHSDDGIVLRLPDVSDPLDDWTLPSSGSASAGGGSGPGDDGVSAGSITLDDLLLDPLEVTSSVIDALAGSAHFASRFREAAARSLLLPRRRPDGRQPLWQQRQRASQLLSVASRYPEFPVVLEAVRESIQDDFDTPALVALMTRLANREIRVVEVTTPSPSPAARSLLFSYVGAFLYDGDAPLAERRAAALTLDPALLAELLGQGAADLADLLDPEAVLRVEAEIGLLSESYLAKDAEGVIDVIRRIGPLTSAEVVRRAVVDAPIDAWLADLVRQRRIIEVRVAGCAQWAVVEDAGRLRDALGVALPVGLPEALLASVPDPLGDLVRRHARSHGPFTVLDIAARFALAPGQVSPTLGLLVSSGILDTGRLRPWGARATPEAAPNSPGSTDPSSATSGDPVSNDTLSFDTAHTQDAVLEYCDKDVLRRMRRRSLAAARADVEAVPGAVLGIFLPRWHQFGQLRGTDGVLAAVEQLAGARLDAADVESSILPSRIADYSPAALDELTTAGEVTWVGVGAQILTLIPSDSVALLAPSPQSVESDLALAVIDALSEGGRFFRDLVQQVRHLRLEAGDAVPPTVAAIEEALWDAVWSGHVTNDSLAPVRALVGSTRTTGRSTNGRQAQSTTPRRLSRRGLLTPAMLGDLSSAPKSTAFVDTRIATPETAVGRWSLVPERVTDPTVRAAARAASLLERHGVVLRGVASAEEVTGGFSALYPLLARWEETGKVRRGYLVEGQGAAQFALPECVDRLRADASATPGPIVLAAADPANPYGALLPWPRAGNADGSGARPRRVAGADVVLVNGILALFVERGGGSVLSFESTLEGAPIQDLALTQTLAARELAAVARQRYQGLTIRKVDGEPSLTSASPLAAALRDAGFLAMPQGLRLRTAGATTAGQGHGPRHA